MFSRICGVVAIVAAVLVAFGAEVLGLSAVDLLAIGVGAAGLGLVTDGFVVHSD